ncbi:50S ribosomal protein L40e [Candidatus Woesearchaeota archaeon]|nr:50S ribosomal protein L40e [Candidatus Woesearchaeota archaeon]
MVKFAEAEARKFRNKFVCRRCKTVLRAPSRKVADSLVKCRKCQGKKFKPKRKK